MSVDQTTLDLLTRAEAAQLLRVHPKTLDSWIYAGHVPTVKIGGRVYLTRPALLALIEASTRPATAGPLAGKTA